MLTAAELRTEIQSGPLAAELAPLVEVGDDEGVRRVLMEPRYDGYIPPVPLLKLITEGGLLAKLDIIRTFGKLPAADPTQPPSLPAPTGVLVLAFQLDRVFAHELRMSKADAAAGCDALVAVGLMPPPTKDQVLALEVKISRAQQLWYYDVVLTAQDCSQAR
jgi:hypothetical protein